MAFIIAEGLKHFFQTRNEAGEITGEITALNGVDLEVEQGQFIAILGHNGSGKSTLAKHINVLLHPNEGTLWVDDKNATYEENVWDIREAAGMIFQNPDNQIVAGVVEEDVAFGPENIGVPTEEIRQRVADSLATVDMSDYRLSSPNKLSGGQKQRVAVAGVMAMHPRCIIMDEPTAMLDPAGRQEVLQTVHRLNQQDGVTVVLITHYMEEAARADKVFVMDKGKIVMQGTSRSIFSQRDKLKAYGLDVPQITCLAEDLREAGLDMPAGILNRRELKTVLEQLRGSENSASVMPIASDQLKKSDDHKEKLRLTGVSYTYGAGTIHERKAVQDVNLTLYEGELTGVIGHTGSGKSTLIQMLNGLLKPSAGQIAFEGTDIYSPGYSLRKLRGKVGLVFQYPEYQLFEVTVLKDVAFGPKNQGCSEGESLEKARKALERVGLPEECWEMSPFELSGGEKRRAAIAGVIATEPEVLVLDEPTAGLDPGGRDDLFSMIQKLNRELHMTILLVSHSMEDVADYVQRILVLDGGRILMDGTPEQIFARIPELEQAGLGAPQVTYLMEELRQQGWPVPGVISTVEGAKEAILNMLRR